MNPHIVARQRESRFAEFLEKRELAYEHPSHRIYLLNGKPHESSGVGYIPDFFVPSLNTYFEVVGSRQAFEQNKEKIKKFQKHYNLIVCTPDGLPYVPPGKSKNRWGGHQKIVHSCPKCGKVFKARPKYLRNKPCQKCATHYKPCYCMDCSKQLSHRACYYNTKRCKGCEMKLRRKEEGFART